MNDPDPDPGSLGTALHDRVRDERPDLDRLVQRATTGGRRLRRRRRAGSTLAAVVGVAAVATLGTQLAGGTTPSSGGPAYVASPSASASAADASEAPPSGASGTPAPDALTPPIRISQLQRIVEVLREELRDEPAGTPRADELRGLLDGVRGAGERGVTRAERVAALERLIDEFQRIERARSAH